MPLLSQSIGDAVTSPATLSKEDTLVKMQNDPLAESLDMGHDYSSGADLNEPQTGRSLMCYLQQYARENPGSVALGCFALGFIVGWKLKPW